MFCFGAIATAISYIASILPGSVIRMAIMMQGALGGPLLGIFVLALFFPWTTTKVLNLTIKSLEQSSKNVVCKIK